MLGTTSRAVRRLSCCSIRHHRRQYPKIFGDWGGCGLVSLPNAGKTLLSQSYPQNLDTNNVNTCVAIGAFFSTTSDRLDTNCRRNNTPTFSAAADTIGFDRHLEAESDDDADQPLRARTTTTEAVVDAHSAIELALDSVVKIFTVSSSPNYFLPWQNKSQRETTGSGFIIPGKRILTNAHVVADHTFVLVRKHGSPTKYRANVQAVGHECDLAILVVEREEFWEGMHFLELGDIPFLQEAVAVVGYPQGGDNISVTKGVVSRVEPTQYVHGATQLLAIQIDAAINPGNSGGPAIMGDKVAGVAFQNLSGAENIG
ncbi:unnamed protein product [Ilex paraguariensis]|uniref:Uncharacterized protein n=1 Tax=Ilex paraguariensis TaxID=185542 RepID=A0ABC8QZ30_9AQUA